MSYERTDTDDAPVWVLEWDHRPGLVVRCTVPSLRAESLGRRVAPLLRAGADREHRLLLALAEMFGEDSLLSWNLTWGGHARPASAEGMARLDRVLVAEILFTWIQAWTPTEPEPASAEVPQEWTELDALSVDLDESDPEPAMAVAVAGG